MRIDAAVRLLVASVTAFTLAGLLASPQASAAPSIFACEPEWAALARVIAPDAQIFSATHAQDPHDIEARPALISALRRASISCGS